MTLIVFLSLFLLGEEKEIRALLRVIKTMFGESEYL